MKCLTLLLNKGVTGCSCITSVDGMVIDQLTWYNSLWLWRWLPHRLSKRQSLSKTTVLFRTTFTQTIKLNLLLNSSSVLWIFQKSHLPVEQVKLRTEFTSPIAKSISQDYWTQLSLHGTWKPVEGSMSKVANVSQQIFCVIQILF